MVNDVGKLTSISPVHRTALAWFADRTGQDISWPEPLDGVYLLNRAKGIHKPAGWMHALSVRQSIGSQYDDRSVVELPDGAWTFDYFQEGPNPNNRDNDFTNRALLQNIKDEVPVAVVHQIKAKPSPRYRVLGLAYVESWEAGYFHLKSVRSELKNAETTGSMPVSLTDARRRINREIIARQGAGAFRASVVTAFGGRCAITGYDVVEGLEAAHIMPYLGTHTNEVTNALLLRADLHTLFDRGLITIDPKTRCVSLAKSLKISSISGLDGIQISLPSAAEQWQTSLEQRNNLYANHQTKAP